MRILIHSHVFHPSVGGSETACRLLADGLFAAGNEIRLVTQIPGPATSTFPYPISRLPSRLELLNLVRWCEVYVHSNISLRAVWPLLWHRRPWVIVHHSRRGLPNGQWTWVDHLKQSVLRHATNIAVSRSMAASLPVDSTVLGNGYDDTIFRLRPEIIPDRDVVFVGRLNRDKGAHLLIEALRILKDKGFVATLTIVGPGAEESQLRSQAEAAGLSEQLVFTGEKESHEVSLIMNRHRVLAVPSLVEETFGMVIMEGLASGCGVIAADVGALKETLGPCGLIFPRGDAAMLAAAIEKMLSEPQLVAEHQAGAASHLLPYQRQNSLQAYLAVIEDAARKAK